MPPSNTRASGQFDRRVTASGHIIARVSSTGHCLVHDVDVAAARSDAERTDSGRHRRTNDGLELVDSSIERLADDRQWPMTVSGGRADGRGWSVDDGQV